VRGEKNTRANARRRNLRGRAACGETDRNHFSTDAHRSSTVFPEFSTIHSRACGLV